MAPRTRQQRKNKATKPSTQPKSTPIGTSPPSATLHTTNPASNAAKAVAWFNEQDGPSNNGLNAELNAELGKWVAQSTLNMIACRATLECFPEAKDFCDPKSLDSVMDAPCTPYDVAEPFGNLQWIKTPTAPFLFSYAFLLCLYHNAEELSPPLAAKIDERFQRVFREVMRSEKL